MKQKTFNMVAGAVFLVVGVAHAVRAFKGWELMVGSVEVPLWLSWVAVLFVGWLSYTAFKMNK